jgi:hypothetical protein
VQVNVVGDGMAFGTSHLLVVASAVAALAAACGAGEESRRGRQAESADLRPQVSATIPIGERGEGIAGVALGEGAAWVAGWGARSASISRIDTERNEVVARIPLEGDVADVAAGEGAVWVPGGLCVERLPEDPDVCRLALRVSRVDPRANEVVATIPIEPPAGVHPSTPFAQGVAVGEDEVWVSVSWNPRESLSWNSTAGEVVRIDPRTNEIVARIDARGRPGELAVGAGSVWVLSDRTAEAEGGVSLHRIDPRSNEIAATPLRGELAEVGGTVMPPAMAVGDDAAWIRSYEGKTPLAIRVDVRTNEVARERFRYFSPVAVTEDGVWVIGADLSRLNPSTLEVEQSINLGPAPGGLTWGDATFDPTAGTFWLAALSVRYEAQSSAIRVDLR